MTDQDKFPKAQEQPATDQEKEAFTKVQEQSKDEQDVLEKPVINYALSLKRAGALSVLYERMIPLSNQWYDMYNEKTASAEVLKAVTIPVPYHAFRLFMNMGYIVQMMASDPKFMECLELYYSGEKSSE